MISREDLTQLADTLEGVPVLGCLAGSPSALAGLRYGDVLLSVNGQRVKTSLEYVQAKELRQDGADIVFFRDGKTISQSIVYSNVEVDMTSTLAEIASMRILGEDDWKAPAKPGSNN